MKSPSKGFITVASFLLVCMAAVLGYIFSTQHIVIQGTAMLPTYDHGTKMNGVRFFGNLHRGDIVIYSPPSEFCKSEQEECIYVARVIGLPKEKLEMANYFVKINDQQIEESYLAPDTHTLFSEKVGGIFYLKDDEYFVMADNRPYADDSRIFGPIKRSAIQSVVTN